MYSKRVSPSVTRMGLVSRGGLAVVSLTVSAVVLGQAAAPGSQTEPTNLTAAACEVQLGEFESSCETEVELLDNKQASVLFVTVNSIPEAHEISFYTEHVGMLVIGVDGGMMIMNGDCRNTTRRLRCQSNDREAMLEIQWQR